MPKKRVKFPVYVQAIYDGELDVPDGIESYEDIQEYIKDHLNDVELGRLEYIPETDEFDPDSDIDIYYYPTKEEEMKLDAMKYRIIKYCENPWNSCESIDHGTPYKCPIYPLCKKHFKSRPYNGDNIERVIDDFEPYEIRDAYADLDLQYSCDEMSYDRKRKRVKEYCDHKDFLHCNIIGICCKHNCSRSKDCYDITEDLKHKWSHKDIDDALEIIEKNKRATKL